jgi:hypothetical protein
MTLVSTLFSLILTLVSVTWALEPDSRPFLDLNDPAASRSHARPGRRGQVGRSTTTYVLIDLVANTILIKGRG